MFQTLFELPLVLIRTYDKSSSISENLHSKLQIQLVASHLDERINISETRKEDEQDTVEIELTIM